MATVLLILVVVLVLAALVFGVVSLLAGDDPGLGAVEPDGRAVALPNNRSLTETDLKSVRFDVGVRGYRMAQVDRLLRRTAYDIGYKDEMIAVLEAEVMALREGRAEDAELLLKARESAANPAASAPPALLGEQVINLDLPGSWDATADGVLDDDSDNVAAKEDTEDSPADKAGVRPVSPAVTAAVVEDLATDVDDMPEDEAAARVEEARKEAATPGRIAGRAGRSRRSSSNGGARTDAGTGEEPAQPADPARA